MGRAGSYSCLISVDVSIEESICGGEDGAAFDDSDGDERDGDLTINADDDEDDVKDCEERCDLGDGGVKVGAVDAADADTDVDVVVEGEGKVGARGLDFGCAGVSKRADATFFPLSTDPLACGCLIPAAAAFARRDASRLRGMGGGGAALFASLVVASLPDFDPTLEGLTRLDQPLVLPVVTSLPAPGPPFLVGGNLLYLGDMSTRIWQQYERDDRRDMFFTLNDLHRTKGQGEGLNSFL